MTRFYFEVDDEEVIRFVKALGRKRSAVMTRLIIQLMNECDEYLPSWLVVETGCNKKVMKKKGDKRIFMDTEKTKEVKEEKPKVANADVALAGLSGFGL